MAMAAAGCVKRLLTASLIRQNCRILTKTRLYGLYTKENTNDKVYLSGFNEIPELQNANEMVKRIFSLEIANENFSPSVCMLAATLVQTIYARDLQKIKRDEIAENFSEDIERKIAGFTMRIKLLLEHCQAHRQDKSNKVFFIWLIDQRKKLLKKLRNENYQAYSDIIEKLSIPPLADPNDSKNKYKFRKYKINVPLKRKRELHEFEYDRNY